MGKNQHVVPDGAGGWNVKGEGNSRATANYAKQSDAVKKLKTLPRTKTQKN